MSKKIIGVTVGTQLPKPNFKQTDPTKGDYIKNKPDFEGLKAKVNTVSELVGDIAVSEQISTAIGEFINIDYDAFLAFDTSEIIFDTTNTASVLGKAVLGQMVLA